jgi:anaerobic C4-dicarboxylate transporter
LVLYFSHNALLVAQAMQRFKRGLAAHCRQYRVNLLLLQDIFSMLAGSQAAAGKRGQPITLSVMIVAGLLLMMETAMPSSFSDNAACEPA